MGGQQSKPTPPPKPTPAPGPVYYKVENNNWIKSVRDSGKAEGWFSEYNVNFNHQKDPAIGCGKDFVSQYKCARSTDQEKTAEATAEAYGKTIVYDCDTEYNIANSNRLYVLDSGNVIIKNDHTGNMLWQSNTNKVGLPTERFKAENSRFKRNYLQAGETLFPNDFIGSPSGNCYLAIFNVSPGVSELRIVYSQAAVGVDGTPKPGENLRGQFGDIGNSQLAGGSMAAYKIKNFDGKPQTTTSQDQGATYITYDLKKSPFPASMINGLNDQYTSLGTFDQNRKYEIDSVMGIDKKTCQAKCTKSPDCWGFVFYNEDGLCSLKNNGMFPADLKRRFNKGAEMYARGFKYKGKPSCPQNSSVIFQDVYSRMPSNGFMTPETSCDLEAVTAEQRNIVAQKEKKLMEATKGVKMHSSDLKSKNIILGQRIVDELGKYQTSIKNYGDVKKEVENQHEQYKHVAAMNESSSVQMISDNYNYLAFTGLAALGVIAAIKATN